ncbi:MAG: Flp pilus assembly complex ATPase component TadA, partial [Myxococcales bacterium]|nr:Flp pilus assembly complex ATPase component TadA [Myxococcales bacterium]
MAEPQARRTEPVSFDELLGWLVRAQLLDTEAARQLFEGQELALAKLVRERRIADSIPAGQEARIAAGISPIELLLSTGARDPAGRPLEEDRVTELFAERVGLPYVKLDPLELDGELITSIFSKPFARKHTLLALESPPDHLVVATSNPFDRWALESVERVAGKAVRLVIASRSDIQKLITEFYGFRGSVKRAEQKLTSGVDLGNLEQFVRLKTEREIEASDQHVVHAVEYMLSYAFQQRASDIHVEPKREQSLIRFRIDGSLHEVNQLPKVVHAAVINRLKTLARLDIGEKRRPQDGRIKTEHEGKAVEIRVSTLPVAFGEKAVLRVFDPDVVTDDLADLGFYPREHQLFDKLIAQPHGIILVTGPTGSGKTTTLYTALRKRATGDVNVTTIEDPIEMVYERINQTAINPAIGLGFAEALRTILRQDPDVIM